METCLDEGQPKYKEKKKVTYVAFYSWNKKSWSINEWISIALAVTKP